MSRSFIVAVALFCAASVATVLGCEDDEKVLVAEGGACASIVDCQPGLSCVATSGDARVCKTASTPLPGTPGDDAAGGDATADTATPDGEADASTEDAAPQDDASEGGPAVDAADATIADASDAG